MGRSSGLHQTREPSRREAAYCEGFDRFHFSILGKPGAMFPHFRGQLPERRDDKALILIMVFR